MKVSRNIRFMAIPKEAIMDDGIVYYVTCSLTFIFFYLEAFPREDKIYFKLRLNACSFFAMKFNFILLTFMKLYFVSRFGFIYSHVNLDLPRR